MVIRNSFYYIAGIVFLALAKTKNIIHGYRTPKPFDISNTERCIEYDIQVVDLWLHYLQKYTKSSYSLDGKNVLELGPGSDLGVGIYLLSKGCANYNTCDVNDLMKSTPDSFYDQFLKKIGSQNPQADIIFLKKQLNEMKNGNPSKLNHVVRNDFNISSAFTASSIDLVFSQAAFEHFDDISETLYQLNTVCKTGAILIAEIDLKTHSRWICDKDPNNIYRYQDYIYNAFWFRGIPNRIRPFQYQDALERAGWSDISIVPLIKSNDIEKCYSGMNKKFAEKKNQMEYLSCMICAKKT